MDLLDRYLQAVKFFLPQRQQDDIVRELSENLLAEMEDREEDLGRPLTEAEQADILKKHGHPAVAAGRYRSRQQLIGAVFFPLYLLALKMGLGVALLVTIVLAAVTGVLDGDPIQQLLKAFLAFPGRALMVFAWTTLGFAGLDMAQTHFGMTHAWDPRSLPKLVRHEHRISRYRSLADLCLTLGYVVWLLLLPARPHLLLGPAASVMAPAPVWGVVYPLIVFLGCAAAALHVANYLRPYWTRRRSLARIGISAASLVTFGLLLRTDEWFVPRSGAVWPDAASADSVLAVINAACQIGLVAAALISTFELSRELYRLNVRGRRTHTADSVV